MMIEQLKILFEKAQEPVLDFCNLKLCDKSNYYAFEAFEREKVRMALAEAPAGRIWFLDYAYSLAPSTKVGRELLLVADHINLSTLNPTLGKLEEGPRFYAVNELYERPTADLPFLEVLVAGLNPGTKPNEAESDLLVSNSVKYYSYNSVRAALLAAQRGLKVISLALLKAS